MNQLINPAGKPELELHFPDREVDNPTVFSRVCFSVGIHQRMTAGLEQGYGYAVLIVARAPDDTEGLREIREVRPVLLAGKFITFSRPGMWEVGVFLFERTYRIDGKNTAHVLERDLRDRFLSERDKKSRWRGRFLASLRDFSSITCSENGWEDTDLKVDAGSTREGWAVAKYEVTVNIPHGIFAREPSPFVKSFGNYFFKTPPYDQCEFRNRLLGMTLLGGFIPWLLFEAGKRLICLVGGLVLFAFAIGGSLELLRFAFSGDANLSLQAATSRLMEVGKEAQYVPDLLMGPYRRKHGGWFTPGMLLIESGVVWVTFHLVKALAIFVAAYPGEVATSVVLIAAIVAGFFVGIRIVERITAWSRARKQRRLAQRFAPPVVTIPSDDWWARLMRDRRERLRNRPIELGKLQAAFALRQAEALVCGEAPKEVSISALPPEMVTLWTRFDALKRSVCRPFG